MAEKREYMDLDGGEKIVEDTSPFCAKCGKRIDYPWDKPCEDCFPVEEKKS